MANDRRSEFSSVKLDVGLGTSSEPAAKPTRDDPFRVVILGDFRGRGNRSDAGERRQTPVKIDRDNFDDVLQSFAPALEFSGAGRIAISELDDFHPDRLLRQPFFLQPREAAPAPVAEPRSTPKAAPPPADLLSGSLLDGILEATEDKRQSRVSSDPLQAWVEQRIAPHLVPVPSSSELDRRASAENAQAAQLRGLLHAPVFQSLEALWRATDFLVRHTDTDGPVSIWLVDITREDLARDLGSAPTVAELPLYRSLRSKVPAVLVGAYDFGVSDADLETLVALGTVAEALGASCVVGAQPQWIGCERYEALESPREWASPPAEADLFRSTAAAHHVGLTGPRFLLRLPYGAKTDTCEAFPFEEMGDGFEHDRLLWGNSAILCACLLAASFNEDGWDLRPGTQSNLDGLPIYIHQLDGETVAQPCAETLMTEQAADAMMRRGVMCLASMKDSDAVRMVRFHNAAAPAGPLAGQWLK